MSPPWKIARSLVLERLRADGRPVAWTPEFMGLGNLLFVACWVHEGRLTGEERYFLRTAKLEPWLPLFPGLAALSLARTDVAFRDQRVMPWRASVRRVGGEDARTGDALDLDGIAAFVRNALLPLRATSSPHTLSQNSDNTLVINVRRGDYYSDPENRGHYGFDVDAYLKLAVARTVDLDGKPDLIRIVSDGLDWCRARLTWLAGIAEVSYAQEGGRQVADLLEIASARRLIITNSTFSYWGAYIGNVAQGNNHRQVVAPAFFDRTVNNGRSWLLDPRWTVIEDIPGGWDS